MGIKLRRTNLLLACFVAAGCSSGGAATPSAPAALPSDQQAEVDAMLQQASAIVRVARTYPRRSQFDMRGPSKVEDAERAAESAKFALTRGRFAPDWFERAHGRLAEAEAKLHEELGNIGHQHCRDDVALALRNVCAKLGDADAANAKLARQIEDARIAVERALARDGEKATLRIKNETLEVCRRDADACLKMPATADNAARLGVLAGVTLFTIDVLRQMPPRPERDEIAGHLDRLVRQTSEQAETNAADHVALKEKIAAEEVVLRDASIACDDNATACKAKCDASDGAFCAAWARKLWKGTPAKLADAKAAMSRACSLQILIACAAANDIEQEIAAKKSETESLWSEVEQVGDDLARKHHQTENVAKMANRPHLQAAVQKMRIINQAIVTEKYCPSRRAFIANAGIGEFQKRAAAHCRDNPPTGTGISGAEVTLSAQCSAAFASGCP